MVWVPDSTTPGYLGPLPAPSPSPPSDDAWDDFLHDVIAGITGLDPALVRPRWQREPPNMPDFDTDWVGFGVIGTETGFEPAVIHVGQGDGYDALQEQEVSNILCSFYGPHAARYASYLRRGFFVWQNRAMLRANAVGLIEISGTTAAPELVRNQWLNRVDLTVRLNREIRYDYAVRNIVRATGEIIANDIGTRVITDTFDTAALGTLWDNEPYTAWDDGKTTWD